MIDFYKLGVAAAQQQLQLPLNHPNHPHRAMMDWISLHLLQGKDPFKKTAFKTPSFAPPGPTDFMSLHKLQAPGLSAEHPLKKQMSMLQGGKGQHAFKFGGTLANVIREDDDDNQTHQRQAQSLENMSMTGPGVSGVWDRFDDRIQNPAVASEHVRFVGE